MLGAALSEHDSAIAPQTLTSLSLSDAWRRLIAAALESYFWDAIDNASADNEDKLIALYEDLYD